MLLAIDPGLDTGWALFDDPGRLVSCGLGAPAPVGLELFRVLIECPKLRPRVEKNPNAILLVARQAGEWAGRYHGQTVEYLTPNDWKGSTPKHISHRRIFAALTAEEIGRLVRGCTGVSPRSKPINEAVAVGLTEADKRHNILDAIGIGLYGVGRGGRR